MTGLVSDVELYKKVKASLSSNVAEADKNVGYATTHRHEEMTDTQTLSVEISLDCGNLKLAAVNLLFKVEKGGKC